MKNTKLSFIIQAMYDSIPEAERNNILKEKGNLFSTSKNQVRFQPWIMKEVYVCLARFGAFTSSDSDFFNRLACEYIEKRAVALGMMNTASQHAGGR